MGRGIDCTCNKCGYSFNADLGIGFLYPNFVIETKKKMIDGKYGDKAKHFFERYPYGTVDCERVVVRCSKCKEYGTVLRLDLYKPKKGLDITEAMLYDTDSYFDLSEKYNHVCEECGEKLEIIEDFVDKTMTGEIKCLKCDGLISVNNFIYWD